MSIAGKAIAFKDKHVWAAPVLAALLYPAALLALFHSGRMLRSAVSSNDLIVGAVTFILFLLVVYGVPTLSFIVAYRLSKIPKPSLLQLQARRFAHLAFASPPLFTCIGVILSIFRISNGDYLVWALVWIPIGFLICKHSTASQYPASSRPVVWRWLRGFHGITALAILLIFLLPHITNHLTAIWSVDAHRQLMQVLRYWYRSDAIQPILVVLFICQVVSGALLWRSRTTLRSDIFGTLQTTSGAYLTIFIISHMTAVFVLGRIVLNVDTDFYFASGGAAGLLADPWNVRLIPHYSLAVWMLFVHLACGLRFRLLTVKKTIATANKFALIIIALGAVIALAIVTSMCGVHILN